MEGLSPSDSSKRPIIVDNGGFSSTSSASKSNNTSSTPSQDGLVSKIANLSNLSEIAQNSSPDIRPEAVERAKALLDDPNWLNNTSLENLAKKIAHQHQF